MITSKALPSLRGVPPPEGTYSETMPADQGHDAGLLQAALLGQRRPRRLSAVAFLTDWLIRAVEWVGRIWFNWLSAVTPRRDRSAR